MTKGQKVNRRRFLKKTAGTLAVAFGFPYIVSPSAPGAAGTVAPSNRITLGCIGTGWMGTENLQSFLNEGDARIIAVCDLDKNHLNNAARLVNEKYGNKDCATYHDFRELIARDDIDAVSLGVPDHWHGIPAIEAARAGKDIYSEKPLSHSLREGRAMCDAVKRYERIWQTGSWQRSVANFRSACMLVRNGRIGKVTRAEVGLPAGHTDFAGTKNQTAIQPPPAELDYERWLGPAPYAPYAVARVHKNWRWSLDYGGGQIMDWIGHHGDIAHWGLGFDYESPVEVEGRGEYPRTGLWNTATRFKIRAVYANGVEMLIGGGAGLRSGTKWIGEDGWVWVDRERLDAEPAGLLKETFGPNDIQLYRSLEHQRNFLDCIKSRRPTITPCEVSHHSVIPGHLGQIAMLLGRKIRFDPKTEEIIGDAEADEMLGRPMRSPWHL